MLILLEPVEVLVMQTTMCLILHDMRATARKDPATFSVFIGMIGGLAIFLSMLISTLFRWESEWIPMAQIAYAAILFAAASRSIIVRTRQCHEGRKKISRFFGIGMMSWMALLGLLAASRIGDPAWFRLLASSITP